MGIMLIFIPQLFCAVTLLSIGNAYEDITSRPTVDVGYAQYFGAVSTIYP